MTGNADDIAHIQQLEKTKGSFANEIEFYVKLEPGAVPLDVGETRFAVQPQSQNTSRCSYSNAVAFKGCRIALSIGGNDVGRGRGLVEVMRIVIFAARFDLGELFLALEILIERFEGQGGFPFDLFRSIPMAFLERQENAYLNPL
jgi:hypothetical protein